MKEDWVKQLRDKLADHQESAPADMWAQIEARLSQSGAVHQPVKKSRLVSIWAKYIAVAAAFVGMITCNGYLLWSISNEGEMKEPKQMASNRIMETKQEKTTIPSQEDVSKDSQDMVVTQTSKPATSGNNLYVKVFQQPTSQDAPIVPQEEPADQQDVSVESAPASPWPQKSDEREEKSPEAVKEKKLSLRDYDEKILSADDRQRPRQISFGLYAQNGFGNETSANGVLMSPQLAANYDYRHDLMSVAMARGADEVIYLANYEERQKHYQPISFGLSVNIPISSSLSLTTGLVYTRLRSDFVAVMGGYPMTTEQTLHYLGVPLNVQYRLWGYKGLKVYGVAGVAADYNIKSQQEMEGLTQEISRDRWQFSLKGGLGVEYDVIPQLGIYVEPGLKYYFDNGSRVQNFFKDKPTNFNLQVGFRWNLR
jgi:opacity protein-like surface antigen